MGLGALSRTQAFFFKGDFGEAQGIMGGLIVPCNLVSKTSEEPG